MKTSRVISIIVLITAISLFYVYQQTEIFRMAYNCQKRSSSFQELLDKNTILRYNIKRAESLIYIGDKVSESEEFQMPDSFQVVKVFYEKPQVRSVSAPAGIRLVSRLFGIRREAEARTIRPSLSP